MPVIEIDGVGRVEVGNEFLSMPRDQQDSFIGSIVSSVKAGARSSTDAPIAPMGSDGVSGDEIRARNAGDTRAGMGLKDIEFAYDAAQGNRPEQKALAEAFVKRERADAPVSTGISDRVRQVAKGVPVLGGFLDEANAATSSLLGGNYEKALDYQRARDRVFEAERPKESLGLQIGGGVAGGIGMLGPLSRLAQGASPVGTIARSTGIGAGTGAVDSFARGEDGLENRAKDAGTGAIVGGVLGGLAPVVASGVSKGASKIADMVRTNRDVGALGLSRPAGDVINRVMSADDALGPVGAANIARGGQDAMLADAGRSASGLLDTVIQRGGPGANVASRAVNDRASIASANVRDALDNALGTPKGLQSAEEAIRKGSAGARKAAYDAAYGTPVNYVDNTGRALEDALKRVPGDAFGKANLLMKLKGEKSRQIMAQIADDGSVTFQQMPDVRQIDYITRALNQAAKSGEGQGALGGQTPLGQAYQDLSREIRGLLRQNVPAYGKALDTAADPIDRRLALEFGSSLLSARVTRDEVARTVKGMSQAELAAAKQGVRAQIDDAMANVSRIMSDPNLDARQATKALRDLTTSAAREKAAALLGKTEAEKLYSRLDEAARAFELRASVADNSKTYARQAMSQATNEMTAPGAVGLLKQGHPILAGRNLLQGLLSSGPEAQIAAQDKIYGEIARALTEKRGAEAQRLARELADAYARKGQFDKGAQALGLLFAGGATGGAYPAISNQIRQ